MAASRVGKTRRRLLLGPVALTCLLACGLLARGASGQIQIDGVPGIASSNLGPGAVPGHLVQSALNHLNDDSPSARTYRHGSLVAAQKLTKPPFVVYRLTLNLDPVCKVNEETCPRETCTLDVRQNERGDVDILKDSVHCQYLQSHFKKENSQEVIENIEKQIINQSSSLDREVQISTDHNDRPFIAVRATQSDYCPGCPYELNPSLPGLSAFGDQVVHSMDEAGISDFKHKLISIVRVTRAVPPNSNVIQYQLLMEIGETTCLRTSLIEISECSLQSNLPIKMCLVTFEERPWQADSRRITKNNCTELLNIDNEVSASVDPNSLLFESAAPNKEDDSTKTEFYDQIAQEAQEVFRMPYMDISTKDSIEGIEDSEALKELPHSKVILEKTKEKEEPTKLSDRLKEFDKFLEDFNIPIKTETTSPKNLGVPVTEQMIIKEHVGDPIDTSESPNTKVTEKTPDENEELQQSQNPVLIPTAESKRSKRSATKVLENNKYALRKLAIKAVEMIDNLDEDDKKKHVIDVIDSSSERQYHGIIYHITVEVAPTDCREAEKSTECLDEVIPGPTQICKLDVSTNEKKPLQSLKLLYYSCKNKKKTDVRMKRQILGGLSVYDKNKPEIDEYVNLGLRKVSENYEGTQEPAVHEIKNVTVQVVAGYLYRIEVDIGDSTCKKGETEKCNPLKSDKGVKRCIIKAWTRAWINNGKPEIEVKCDESRRKRSLRGQHYSESMLEQSRQWKKTEAILFSDFMKQYNKTYETEKEKLKRFQIFKENLDIIQELQINELGSGRYGVTQFADLTKEEFKKWHLGLNPGLSSENNIPLQVAEIPNVKLPPSFDWREHNAVTPVKNQGMCGSCWAFSVTGNVEGQYAIKHKKLLSLSEQELVDCDTLDSGCNGGLPDTAYRAIEQLGGLETESDYPYEAEKETCHFNRTAAKVHIRAGLNISSNETQMAQWLIQNGPMSIGINANAMQFYMGGVSHPFHFLCNPDDLDHGVLIVGYGMKSYPYFKKKLPYWLIKNSWGPHWGEQGYYRVYRGDGTCGVNKMVTSAVVE